MSRRSTTPADQARWAAERDARTTALLDQLHAGVTALQASDQFRRYLRTAAAFHTYSFNNVLLIHLQRPEATRVAGYRAWQQLGRQVRKGEQAIYIFAPRPYQVTTTSATGDDDTRAGCAFRAVPVFDLAQTDGDPLATLDVPTLTGDGGSMTYAALCAIAEADGLHVTTHDPLTDGDDARSSYQGYYRPGHALIFVKAQATAQMCKTLVHELAHHLDPELRTASREEGETVAEAVAFVVAAHQGIDTSSYSFPYLASWAGRQDGGALLRQVLSRVQAIAHHLLSALESDGAAAAATHES